MPENPLPRCSYCQHEQQPEHAVHHELCRYVSWSVETIKKLAERVDRLERQIGERR